MGAPPLGTGGHVIIIDAAAAKGLTATDLRTSKTAKIKKLFYCITAHRRTPMCSRIVK